MTTPPEREIAALLGLNPWDVKGKGGGHARSVTEWRYTVNPGCVTCSLPMPYHRPGEQNDDHTFQTRCQGVEITPNIHGVGLHGAQCETITTHAFGFCSRHRHQEPLDKWHRVMQRFGFA